MAEHDNDDKHIKCFKCKCMYHNNDESIKDNFGFKRLGERYKVCVKCRTRAKDYYKANASEICDYQYNKYYEPCEICNNKVYKDATKQHLEVCSKYYKPRDTGV